MALLIRAQSSAKKLIPILDRTRNSNENQQVPIRSFSMSIGDIAVAFVAYLSLAFLALIILSKVVDLVKNWRAVVEWSLVVGYAGISLSGFAATAVIGGITAYKLLMDRRMMQCTTLYERQIEAYAAPDDYFGRQLRKTIAGEAKQCADYASIKRASDVTASTQEVIDASQR
jgi:hypothetical protein